VLVVDLGEDDLGCVGECCGGGGPCPAVVNDSGDQREEALLV